MNPLNIRIIAVLLALGILACNGAGLTPPETPTEFALATLVIETPAPTANLTQDDSVSPTIEPPSTTPVTSVVAPSPQIIETPTTIAANPSDTSPSGQRFILLVDPLDEPEFYCVDVPGAGRSLNLEADLHAHTCKPLPQAEDELFTFNSPGEGQFRMEAYDLCMEAREAEEGAALILQTCSDSALQRFTLTTKGLILLNDGISENLCLAVAPGEGIPTGGPSHLRRHLGLQGCDSVPEARSVWSLQ